MTTKTEGERIKISLRKSLKKYKSDQYLADRLGNDLLQEILSSYRNGPSLSRMIQFIKCLNYFYSTRIQLAEGTLNDNIIIIAKIVHANWRRGINLFRLFKESIPNLNW
jgi:hypothetical protein